MPNEIRPVESGDAPPPSGSEPARPAEAVRLVVWDLDETFWKGTLTEGGIAEYVQAHHDIIIELARRGIMSSVCSKNDAGTVLPILMEKGILDYIVFPSISWDPKGMRLAALVEAVQLRPETVMFIDDNPNNLAEARAVVAGIQVENERFIARLLDDPRFKGKDDGKLTRLAQYKLLETRKKDEAEASGDNAAFLRGCDIRVYIEHDVESHIDRAIELINRTNQLNYTKKRLPEDRERPRRMLLEQCRRSNHQAGLIRVVDRYGDYGFVGFFMMRNRRAQPVAGLANQTLIHYCFSCRTLGMLVEQWFYEYLKRPELTVVGAVLTDLAQQRTIDWIRLVTSLSDDAGVAGSTLPAVRVLGGCEANAVAHFLSAHSRSVSVTGNFAAGPLFVRVNSASLLLSACDHAGPAFEAELAALGLSRPLLGAEYFDDAEPGTVFVFSGAYDGSPLHHYRYRHLVHGWEIKVVLNGSLINFVAAPEEAILALQDLDGTEDEKQQTQFAVRHIRENYEVVRAPAGPELERLMQDILGRIPVGSRFIILLDDERIRKKDNVLRDAPAMIRYNREMRRIASHCPFATAISIGDFIQGDDEIQGEGNHYHRMTYWRLSEKIVEVATEVPAKTASDKLVCASAPVSLQSKFSLVAD